jgi:hypothetical protein
VLQDYPPFLCDLLRFFARPKKPETHIVGRPNVSEATRGRIVWITPLEGVESFVAERSLGDTPPFFVLC